MRACPQCSFPCEEAHKFCPTCGYPISKVATQNDDPLVGRTLPGGYVILELVGVGGMGRVYRAEQTNLGRTVAVKIVHPHLGGEESAAARFITEARAASSLNHPNSVSVIDFGKTEDDQLYLVMEFLRGKDLARVQYEEGPLPFRRIINVLRQVLAALSEAHALGIIHRDLKPENVVLEPNRQGGDFVKVVDFGLAKIHDNSPGITNPGIVCGTPEYMSPEQGRGDPLDARSDVYAMGIILYQLLTNQLPFEAENGAQVVLMHINEPPIDPRQLVPEREIPTPLAEACLTALAKEPSKRFQDADAFSATLGEVLGDLEGLARSRASVACGACSARNPARQKFCGECGAPLDGDAIPSVRPAAPPSSQIRAGKRTTEPARALAFVERDLDLRWLEHQLKGARDSFAGARIVADSGGGKTRALAEFSARVRQAGGIVATTAADPWGADVGFYAIRRVVISLAGLPANGGTVADWGAVGTEALVGLQEIFNAPTSGASEPPGRRRFAVAEALRWALVRASKASQGRPVVVLVDDLHQIDGASRSAFAAVLQEPPLVPGLLVLAHTPGFTEPAISDALAPNRPLLGLSLQAVERALGGHPLPAGLGNGGRGVPPLYVMELLRFVQEHGGPPPLRMADLIAARVERLQPDARRVLQAICIWGDEAPRDAVGAFVSDGTQVDAGLEALVAGGFVTLGERGYSPVHPLQRDVVLATIPVEVRRQLHEQAAAWGGEHGTPIEALALHQYNAQNSFQALVLLEKVAARCASRGDSEGRIGALRRCLELARRELFRGEIDEPERAMLIFSRKLAAALAEGEHFTDAEGVLREALDIAAASSSDRARIFADLANLALGRERRMEAAHYYYEAVDLSRRISGAHDLTKVLATLGKSFGEG